MELTEQEKQKVKYAGLRSEMAKYGHKIQTLSKLLDLSESSISRRFSGEIPWTIEEISKICEFYKKSYLELFT